MVKAGSKVDRNVVRYIVGDVIEIFLELVVTHDHKIHVMVGIIPHEFEHTRFSFCFLTHTAVFLVAVAERPSQTNAPVAQEVVQHFTLNKRSVCVCVKLHLRILFHDMLDNLKINRRFTAPEVDRKLWIEFQFRKTKLHNVICSLS